MASCHWVVFRPTRGRGLVSPQHVQRPRRRAWNEKKKMETKKDIDI